ncbi:hypothetical protein PX52LOC_03838 [Limnoglobus roseus]|uniref:Uncharacterized protein n=1 Tax=Limnoglobus roseus TaxID=2598579 RepID=A0A5C1AIB0_9BACT|nr:hypothetical protein PX52LOC_03838 [Limnoglobus roseus]
MRAGPAADYLNAKVDLDRVERAAVVKAIEVLTAALTPSQAALIAYRTAIGGLVTGLMHTRGYRFTKPFWRKCQMSVELFTKLDGAAPHTVAEVAAVTDVGRDARAAWLDLLVGGDEARRAALTAELAARRAGWATPADPPAVILLADVLMLTWLEFTFYSRESARAWAERLPEELRQLYADRSAAADRRLAELHRDLVAVRGAMIEWAVRLEELAVLRKEARRRKRVGTGGRGR